MTSHAPLESQAGADGTAHVTRTDKRLTKNDQRNVALISSVEKEFGGALVDKDFQAANPASAEDVAPPIPYEGTA